MTLTEAFVGAIASPARVVLQRWRERVGRELLLLGLALSAACAGIVFLSAGSYFLLASVTSTWAAALIIGLAWLLLATALLLVARRRSGDPSSSKERGTAAPDEAVRLGRMLAQNGAPPADLVLTSLLAGFALSAGWRAGRARSRAARESERGASRANDRR